MKKICSILFYCLVFVILFVISVTVVFASFNAEDITQTFLTDHYYMMSLDDGYEIFSKNENDHLQPAAMNKVLAAIVAIEKWGNLDDEVLITEQNIAFTPSDYSARKCGFSVGDSYTKLQLIQAMLVYSANDAEAVIAYEISGSIEEFEKEMNSYAKKIGCNDTNVESAFGFDTENQYISTKDVATIFAYGMKNSTFADIIQSDKVVLPASVHTSEKTYNTATTPTYATSKYYHQSIKGGKETFTGEAGRCIAVVTNLDGYSYIAVSMGGIYDGQSDIITSNNDIKSMISWAYSNLNIKTIIDAGQVVRDLPITGGKNTDKVQLCPSTVVSSLVLSNVSSDSVLVELKEDESNIKLSAPINQGDFICKANVLYANEIIAEVDLVAASSVSLSTTRLVLEKIANFLTSGIVIFLEIVLLIVLIVILVSYLKNIMIKNETPDDSYNDKSKNNSWMQHFTGFISNIKFIYNKIINSNKGE